MKPTGERCERGKERERKEESEYQISDDQTKRKSIKSQLGKHNFHTDEEGAEQRGNVARTEDYILVYASLQGKRCVFRCSLSLSSTNLHPYVKMNVLPDTKCCLAIKTYI